MLQVERSRIGLTLAIHFFVLYFVQLRIAKVNPILLLSTCSTSHAPEQWNYLQVLLEETSERVFSFHSSSILPIASFTIIASSLINMIFVSVVPITGVITI